MKATMGHVRWLELEWSEGDVREVGRPARWQQSLAGVREPVGAMKRRNGRGAKGLRKADARRSCPGKTNCRQCRQRLSKTEIAIPMVGWNPRCGRLACWQPSKEE